MKSRFWSSQGSSYLYPNSDRTTDRFLFIRWCCFSCTDWDRKALNASWLRKWSSGLCQFEVTRSSGYIRRLGNLNIYIPVPALLFHVYMQVGPPDIFLYFSQKCLKPHPGSRVRNPAETRDFSLTQNHPDRVWSPHNLPLNGYRVSLPGVKRPAREVDQSRLFIADVKNGWHSTSPPVCQYGEDSFALCNVPPSLEASWHCHQMEANMFTTRLLRPKPGSRLQDWTTTQTHRGAGEKRDVCVFRVSNAFPNLVVRSPVAALTVIWHTSCPVLFAQFVLDYFSRGNKFLHIWILQYFCCCDV